MFKITKPQIASFQQVALTDFEASMVERAARVAPTLAIALGEDQVLVGVRAAIARAARHGFTFTGPVRLFVELSFLFGSSFDVDVQYPWARAPLVDSPGSDQMVRASALHAASKTALRRIHGFDDVHTLAALRRIPALAQDPPELRAYDFPATLLETMKRVHPQKYAFVGAPALLALIVKGEAAAGRYGLHDLHETMLLVALMFTFGQGCCEDPLYPWIAGTLSRETIETETPALRARKLEETMLTWLDQVLVNKELSV